MRIVVALLFLISASCVTIPKSASSTFTIVPIGEATFYYGPNTTSLVTIVKRSWCSGYAQEYEGEHGKITHAPGDLKKKLSLVRVSGSATPAEIEAYIQAHHLQHAPAEFLPELCEHISVWESETWDSGLAIGAFSKRWNVTKDGFSTVCLVPSTRNYVLNSCVITTGGNDFYILVAEE